MLSMSQCSLFGSSSSQYLILLIIWQQECSVFGRRRNRSILQVTLFDNKHSAPGSSSAHYLVPGGLSIRQVSLFDSNSIQCLAADVCILQIVLFGSSNYQYLEVPTRSQMCPVMFNPRKIISHTARLLHGNTIFCSILVHLYNPATSLKLLFGFLSPLCR